MNDKTAYELCSWCRGYGMVDGLYGVRVCSYCRGTCIVRARDRGGRFTRLPVPA